MFLLSTANRFTARIEELWLLELPAAATLSRHLSLQLDEPARLQQQIGEAAF